MQLAQRRGSASVGEKRGKSPLSHLLAVKGVNMVLLGRGIGEGVKIFGGGKQGRRFFRALERWTVTGKR